MAFDIAGARQAGYSDDEIADFLASQGGDFDIAGARKAGYSASEILDFVGTPQKPPTRTWGEAASDTAVQLGEGVNTILGAVPNLIAPESDTAGFFNRNAQYWRDQQSDALKSKIATADQAITAAGEDGVLSQIAEAASQYFSDPAMAARFVTTNLPSMIPGIGTAKVAQVAALAKGASAARAAQVATTAAGATNAVLNAGGARGEAFEDIKNTLIKQGMTPEQAEEQAIKDSRVVAAIGAATGYFSGKTGLEKAITGGVAKGGARAGLGSAATELIGEQLEEVTPKLATNVQASQYDNRSIGKDVGRTIVETAIGSGPGAIVSGGFAAMAQPASPNAAPTVDDITNAETVDDAIAAAQAVVDTPIAIAPDQRAGFDSQDAVAALEREVGMAAPEPAAGGEVVPIVSPEAEIAIPEAPELTEIIKRGATRDELFAQREAELRAQEDASREEGLKKLVESVREQQVEQAEILTKVSGFDSAEPTAMQLAMERARQKAAPRLTTEATNVQQTNAVDLPSVNERSGRTEAGTAVLGDTATGRTPDAQLPAAQPDNPRLPENTVGTNVPAADLAADGQPALTGIHAEVARIKAMQSSQTPAMAPAAPAAAAEQQTAESTATPQPMPGSRAEKYQKATSELEALTSKQLREISRTHKRAYMREAASDILQTRDAENRAKRSEAMKKVIAKNKRIDPDRDSMAQAIAKLGGISRESATGRLRLTPEELGARGQGLMRVFTQTGKTMDEMGAALAELGYVQRDENGKHDQTDFEDKLAEVAGGLDVFTPQGMMIKAQEEYEAAQREVGAESSEEYEQIQDYADAIEPYIDDPDEWLRRYDADLANDPDVDFSTAGQVEFEAENEPFTGPLLMNDEEVDNVAEQIENAESGRGTEEDPAGDARESAEGTRTPEESGTGEDSRIAEQKRDEYTQDMFGAALPEAAGENLRGEGKRAAETAGDMDSADAVPSGSRFSSRTKVVAENTRTLGATSIKSEGDAAQAMAYLSRGAVERLDALITDADGKPLAVVGAFKGALAQASVYPSTIAGEAFRIKGAANIWFAHNHPSGSPDLSAADRALYGKLKDVFRGSQIAPRGMFAISGGVDVFRSWEFTDGDTDKTGTTTAPTSTVDVPVLERQYSETGTLAESISSPSAAKSVAAEISKGESGILLLDVKNRPIGFVPVEVASPLREGGRMDSLYRALSIANPAGAMIVTNGSLSDAGIRNLTGFLNSIDARVLDVFDISAKPIKSWAEQGDSFGGQTFFSRSPEGGAQFFKQGAFPVPESFKTKTDANLFKVKNRLQGVSAVETERGWLFSPTPAPLTEEQKAQVRADVAELNKGLKAAGATQVLPVYDPPTPQHALTQSIAQVFGTTVRFVSDNKVFDGVAYKGIAYLKKNMSRPELAIAGHEVFHTLEQSNPEMAENLLDHVRTYLKDDVIPDRKMREDLMAGKPVSERYAAGEVLADINGAMWLDPKFWREMAERDTSLFRRVAYLFMEKATQAIESLAGTRFDVSALVTDVDAVRSLIAQTWVEHIESRDSSDADGEMQFSRRDESRDDPYNAAPDELMGFRKDKQQAAFGEQNYRHVEYVRLTFENGESGLDAIAGLNKAHALERARRNWPTAEVVSVSKDAVLEEDPDLVDEVAAVSEGRDSPLQFSRINQVAGTWMAPESSKLFGLIDKDSFIHYLQDKQIDTKRVVQAIRDAVGAIDDKWNPYLQEELFHGRSAKKVKDFLGDELKPLLMDMQMRGVNMADLEEYLQNRHAEERNNQIAKVNPNMPDGGSGIDTADARDYLANLPAGKKRAFEALAKRIDAINKATRKLLVDSGLETQETVDAWEAAYQFYVPLQREESGMGIGQGFSVRGSASKRAMGSKKDVINILANIAMQRERAIVRAEKNRVATALYGLAITQPNPEFWLPVNPENPGPNVQQELVDLGLNPVDAKNLIDEPMQQYIDPRTGLVAERINPFLRSARNVLSVRVNGKDRYVFFNEDNERAMRMVATLKNLDADQLGRVLSLSAKVTRYFASINTQYNPVFGAINLIRDVQGAMLNLSTTPLAGKQKEVMAHTLSALRGIYIDLRDHRAGRTPSSSWAAEFEEFQNEGGQTGYRDMFSNSAERANALKRELKAVSEGKAKHFARAVFDWLSDYNETMENAVRLAAYKTAKEQGMTKSQAASVAKNLTVNFNRKGQVATQAGALYAFFNASVQGTTRLLQTLRGPSGKKIITGGLLLGSMQALLLAAAGFGDDEPPDFVKDRNVVIPVGDGKYLTVPMPLGFNLLPAVSRITTEFVLGGFKDPTKHLTHLVDQFADIFNPIGNAGFSLQTITPTAIDPLAALSENRDWTGKPIAKKDFNSMAPTPGYTRAKDTASEFSKAVSYWINLASGGTKYTPGMVSPTPDQLDYLIGQATGGVGREALKIEQTITSTISGEELPPNKVPFFGRFYGDTKGQAGVASKFYDNLTELNKHEAEIKGRRKDKGDVIGYMRDNPESRLVHAANDAERDVQKLKQKKRELLDKDASKERIKLVEQQITARMKRFNDRVEALRSPPADQ